MACVAHSSRERNRFSEYLWAVHPVQASQHHPLWMGVLCTWTLQQFQRQAEGCHGSTFAILCKTVVDTGKALAPAVPEILPMPGSLKIRMNILRQKVGSDWKGREKQRAVLVWYGSTASSSTHSTASLASSCPPVLPLVAYIRKPCAMILKSVHQRPWTLSEM